MSETKQKALLEVRGLKQYFEIDRRHTVKAVDNVSFRIEKGSTIPPKEKSIWMAGRFPES